MSVIVPTFFAYPSSPEQIGEVVEHAIQNLKEKSAVEDVKSWRQLDIAGRFIADQVLNKIDDAKVFAADVTQLNFNVTYEIGYALAKVESGSHPSRGSPAFGSPYQGCGYFRHSRLARLSKQR